MEQKELSKAFIKGFNDFPKYSNSFIDSDIEWLQYEQGYNSARNKQTVELAVDIKEGVALITKTCYLILQPNTKTEVAPGVFIENTNQDKEFFMEKTVDGKLNMYVE